jgi:tetratricopeptide (TPR) repeat protein
MTGRLDASLKELKRAQQFDPLSVYLLTNLGGALYYARRYDEAIEQLQNAIDLDPNFWFAHIYLGNAYEQKARIESNADQRRSRYEAAIAEYQKTIPVLHDGRGWSAHGLAVAGRQNEARQVLGELKLYKPPPGSWGMAALYTGLGEKDQAFAWLEKARDERFFMLPALKVDPVFESLHSDLRFDGLLRSMGLAP